MARGLVGPIFAMARPRRPQSEAHLVQQAGGGDGRASARAARLAAQVAKAALADVDEVDVELVLVILRELSDDPVHRLATDPEIDTAALIRAERSRRAECRGGRRLPERDWAAEDREILASVAQTLARRYRRILDAPP